MAFGVWDGRGEFVRFPQGACLPASFRVSPLALASVLVLMVRALTGLDMGGYDDRR